MIFIYGERSRQKDKETERAQTKQIEKKCGEDIVKTLPTFSEN